MTVAEVLEVVKISLAVVAGTGGVVALVVAYRKQRITEVGEQREQAELYAERFDKAADQLGSESGPCVRPNPSAFFSGRRLGGGTANVY